MTFWGRLGILFYLCAAWPLNASAVESKFQFQQVIDQARQLASRPFKQEPDNKIPDFLKNLTYDQWRDIRFKDSKTLWQGDKEPFTVRFFHLGFFYHQPVTINYVDGAGVHKLKFSPEQFDYGKNHLPAVPADIGYAGFRIHYPINTNSYKDEIAVFLGATYFRAVAKHQLYGASGRGLAVDTATQTGEEFPFFKEFWIIKPGVMDRKIVIDALMDSPSVSGAFQYIIYPGRQTVMEVQSRLFARKKIEKLGVAPMTSMFLYGENSKMEGNEDFRPEVHDSDGAAIRSSTGEWIWRPLVNPKVLSVNTFEVGTPKGFGLFQRDVNFDHYQDLESRFELRPSLWVVPHGHWGHGHVELLQIPTNSEHNDNIDLYWVPQKPPEAGQSLSFSYSLSWCPASLKEPPLGHVTATRVMRQADKKSATFVIDFQGKAIESIPTERKLIADISVTKGCTVTQEQVFKNGVTNGWRLVFEIQINQDDFLKNMLPEQRPALGLRAFLKDGTHRLTETWDYAFQP